MRRSRRRSPNRPVGSPDRGSGGGRACIRSSPPRSCAARDPASPARRPRGARDSARTRPSRPRAPRPAARRDRSSRTADHPPRAASTGRPRCRTPSASGRPRSRDAARGRRPCGACAPAGMRDPARDPTARNDGPPVSSTRSVSITPASVSTATTRDSSSLVRRPLNDVPSRSSTPADCIASE